MSQARVELGITDHAWQEKRAAIAATVDALGDKFKPELSAGWLAYIRETIQMGRLRSCHHGRGLFWCLVIASMMLSI